MTAAVRLTVGQPVPPLALPDAEGDVVSLADLRGRRVVVYFYPAASTPGCTTQACDFRDSLDALHSQGIEVLGVSPDEPAALRRFRDAQVLTFPLLSDPSRETMAAWGAYGEKKLYGKVVTGVIRSTFLVEADGTLGHAAYAVKATGHVAKLRRDLGL